MDILELPGRRKREKPQKIHGSSEGGGAEGGCDQGGSWDRVRWRQMMCCGDLFKRLYTTEVELVVVVYYHFVPKGGVVSH